MYYAILYKSIWKIHCICLQVRVILHIKIPQYKINEKYVDILHSFTNLTMNIWKHLEYFLYIGKNNSIKNQANNYAGTFIYSILLAKMAIKRLQENKNTIKY